MQPSEADVIAATESLRRQKYHIDVQIKALNDIHNVLDSTRDGYPDPRLLLPAFAEFLRAYTLSLTEQSGALGASVRHNERALEAFRSQILLPHLHQRRQ